MEQADRIVVIAMDPGRKTAFVAITVEGQVLRVMAWGKVPLIVNPGFVPKSILHNPWDSEAKCMLAGPTSISELIVACGSTPQFVWEQQRGYLGLCVGDPFVRYIKSSGYKIWPLPPNEKYFRLAVSKDKKQSIAYAQTYFADISPELAHELVSRPVNEMHDVADACLLAIMWLEEHHRIPILNSTTNPQPSGCTVSGTLANMYEAANVNERKGANITPRIAVTARIAASRARFVSSIPSGLGGSGRRLTRQFLRSLGMPPSEAADLCFFASRVINSVQAPFIGVKLDLNGLSFSIYKVAGNKKSAAAALQDCSLESFRSIMIY